MTDPGHVIVLERRGFRAWPAAEEVEEGQWVFRFARGHTKRANSVTPLSASPADLEKRVADAEARFTAHGLPTIFRLTPLAPPQLLRLLRRRGYVGIEPTFVMTATVMPPEGDVGAVEVGGDPAAWLAATSELYGLDADLMPMVIEMLGRIAGPSAFATLKAEDGTVAAAGYAAVEETDVGLFKIEVRADQRRKGYGTRIMQALIAFGHAHGARRAYLQVREENEPAIVMYRRLGFDVLYSYLHRVKPLEGTTFAARPAEAATPRAEPAERLTAAEMDAVIAAEQQPLPAVAAAAPEPAALTEPPAPPANKPRRGRPPSAAPKASRRARRPR